MCTNIVLTYVKIFHTLYRILFVFAHPIKKWNIELMILNMLWPIILFSLYKNNVKFLQ